MLNEMFFLKLNHKKPKKGMWTNLNNFTPNLNELTFSFTDMISEVKQVFIELLCSKSLKCSRQVNLSRTEKIFIKGFHRISKELDIANLLLTVQKLKAGVSAIIENDQRLLHNTKQFFYTNCTIYSDTEEELEVTRSNKFSDFLEQDDRNMLLSLIEDGDQTALSVLDSVVTDRMHAIRSNISEKFYAIFVKKKNMSI